MIAPFLDVLLMVGQITVELCSSMDGATFVVQIIIAYVLTSEVLEALCDLVYTNVCRLHLCLPFI